MTEAAAEHDRGRATSESPRAPVKSARAAMVLAAVALLVALAQLLRGHGLAWDEIEFFRATKWIGEGRVPFRDFWEHHTPLQWLLFAPIARLFANGPGAAAIVTMRVAQLPLWIATIAMLFAILRREGISATARWTALAFLLANHQFINAAIEYRVDTLGNFAFITALLCAMRKRFVAFGALMSVAVLANMRLAPLVVVAGALMLVWSEEERRWRWSPRALTMIGGIAAVAASFVGWLYATRAWSAFMDAMLGYNAASERLQRPLVEGVLVPVLLAPWRARDVAAIAMWLAALAGVVLALRGIRRPGPLQLVAMLLVVSVGVVCATSLQYTYHFTNAYLLMLPMLALVLHRFARPTVAIAIVALAIVTRIAAIAPYFGAAMQYQNEVMTEVDRRTRPSDVVWDGVGYALRRKPAYRYWFLPAGVRVMAIAHAIEPFGVRELVANPPAAILCDGRIRLWLDSFPQTARWAFRNYVPLYQHLWVPGLSVTLEPRRTVIGWRAPAAGRYDIHASPLLIKHPWLTRPERYLRMEGAAAAEMQIPLDRLPPLRPESLRWRVDGVVQPPGTRTLTLRKGSRVELLATSPVRAGVLLVPEGVRELAKAPDTRIVF